MQSIISPVTAFKLGILFSPMSWVSAFHMATGYRFPRAYLEKHGVAALLKSGAKDEYVTIPGDLARMHKLIMKRRPRVVLEFGSGFSTLVIAHALETLGQGKLYCVDASEHWLDNTRQKLGSLAKRVTLHHSPVEAAEHDGQIVCKYASLPDITPDFIYLDAPGAEDITGNVRGLSYSDKEGHRRSQTAADILLYESSLLVGTYILTDRRYTNVQFLINNLKRNWRIHWDRVQHQVGFELREMTGRSRRI